MSVVMLRGPVEEGQDEAIVGKDALVFLRMSEESKDTRKRREDVWSKDFEEELKRWMLKKCVEHFAVNLHTCREGTLLNTCLLAL